MGTISGLPGVRIMGGTLVSGKSNTKGCISEPDWNSVFLWKYLVHFAVLSSISSRLDGRKHFGACDPSFSVLFAVVPGYPEKGTPLAGYFRNLVGVFYSACSGSEWIPATNDCNLASRQAVIFIL